MTHDEALKLLRGGLDGIEEWNARRAQGDHALDLVGLDLVGADLGCVNFSCLCLACSDFSGAELANADLAGSNLSRVNLAFANCYNANLCNANLEYAHLERANFTAAKLRMARLDRATFWHAVLLEADLTGATITMTDLSGSNMRHAILDESDLTGSLLTRVNLFGASLTHARCNDTVFVCDLSGVHGLDTLNHIGRSHIDINSILHFKDDLPETFLHGCGLRDEEIAYFRSVVGKPIRFYSCFISYSTKDEEYASRLHNDFQAKGIRCWKWDHDARTGRSMWGEIDEAIRMHDKVVLIASESSLKSPAVNREIERAIQEEDRRIREKQMGKFAGDLDVLFPVRVDDYIFDEWEHERKSDVVKKVIADARNWNTDAAVYCQVRDKLIKDLKPN